MIYPVGVDKDEKLTCLDNLDELAIKDNLPTKWAIVKDLLLP